MKQRITFKMYLPFVLLLLILSSIAFATAPEKPYNLRCYDRNYPVGIDNHPYFGWYLNDPDDEEIQRVKYFS